jgi:hypothetical protein
MKIIVSAALVVAQLAAVAQPAFAAEIERETSAAATGTFGGLRLRVPLDGRRNERAPRLGLAFAPTVHAMGEDGVARMRIGEGLEFGFSGRRAAPALSVAGRRLGAAQDGGGIDTAEGILIGAGVVALLIVGSVVWLVSEQNDDNI